MLQNELQSSSKLFNIYQEALHKVQEYNLKQSSRNDALSVWTLIHKQRFLKYLGFFIVPSIKMLKMAAKFVYEETGKYTSIGTIFDLMFTSDKIEEVYELLHDEPSKTTLEWLLKFRFAYAVLGNAAEHIFPNPLTQEQSGLKSALKKRGNLFKINGYSVESTVYEMENTWIREQYSLSGKCEPLDGDTVVSAGAYYGETSIWFAHKVGKAGRVHVFEPVKKFRDKLQHNLRRNKLLDIVKIEANGLWHENTTIPFNPSFCGKQKDNGDIHVVTLDWFVESNHMERIDFIKMDIEGAELKAIQGAKNTIIKYKPKLAICVYHSADDLYTISTYIKALVPHYKLYLSHKNQWWAETVLFASI